jgi:hypothetical protein
MSLATLIKNDPALSERIQRIAEEVKEDNQKIKSFSESYNQKYKKEIIAGTAKKHLLLEEGKRRGLTVQEVEQSSGFIPSIYTPILNWLFFFILEGRNPEREIRREQEDERYRLLVEEREVRNIEKVPEMETYVYGNITASSFQTLKKLKRLSKSPNEHEAFAAYRKCLELCKEYKVEFDRIPD